MFSIEYLICSTAFITKIALWFVSVLEQHELISPDSANSRCKIPMKTISTILFPETVLLKTYK